MNSAPHAIVEINGFQWDSFKHESLFQKVSVELATGEASMATWTCVDERFAIADKYAGIAADTNTLPVIRTWLGYGDALGEPVFKGLVARLERGRTTTTLRAYDMSYRMRLVEKAEYHKGTGLEIIQRLVERNGLNFKGPEKPLKLEPHKANTQDHMTDWQYAAEMAHDEGLVLWTRGDTVFAGYPAKVSNFPKVILSRDQVFILNDYDLQFKVPENVHGRPKGIEVRGRGRGGKRLTGKSDEAQRGREVIRAKKDLAMHTQQRATARAQAQKELDREHAFDVTISTLFAPTLEFRADVRDTVHLQQFGKLFSGDYLIDKLTHDLDAEGHFSTRYELYRDVKES